MATKPNGQGCPGLGLAATIGCPRKKLPNVSVGTAGGRSLNTVWVWLNGTVCTVLLTRLVSG